MRPGRTTPAAPLPALQTCASSAASGSLSRCVLLVQRWPCSFWRSSPVKVDLLRSPVSATLTRAALLVDERPYLDTVGVKCCRHFDVRQVQTNVA